MARKHLDNGWLGQYVSGAKKSMRRTENRIRTKSSSSRNKATINWNDIPRSDDPSAYGYSVPTIPIKRILNKPITIPAVMPTPMAYNTYHGKVPLVQSTVGRELGKGFDAITAPFVVGDAYKLGKLAKPVVSQIISKAVSPIERRIAYVGSRGATVKNFNDRNVFKYYDSRTGLTPERRARRVASQDETLTHPHLYGNIVNRIVNRIPTKENARGFFKKWRPELTDKEIDDFISNNNLFYIKNTIENVMSRDPDKALRLFPNKLRRNTSIFDSFAGDNRVFLPNYKPNNYVDDIVWAHEDAHRLDMLEQKFGSLKRPRLSKQNLELSRDYYKPYSHIIQNGSYRWFTPSKEIRNNMGYLPYFTHYYGTELAARGTQLKNYFGLLKGQRLTPRMIKYARKHYVKDTGLDNNMTDLFNSIADDKAAAAWFNNFSYKYGGIHIDPANRGALTETMKRTGKTKYQLAHSRNPLTRMRAQFAINASHWNHG